MPEESSQKHAIRRRDRKRFVLRQLDNLLPKNRWLKRALLTFIILGMVMLATMYAIAQWYIRSQASKPYTMGVSFIPDYARSLGINPEQTMDALIDDLQIKQFRLVSYWSNIERTQGTYDFSELDWQFAKAEAADAKITLSIGLRQPRWPECHMPEWATREPAHVWQSGLNKFITATVNRYKHSPALESYQLENEYFLKGFGICTNFDRSRLINEYNLVKKLDSQHPLIITRSNNAIGWPVGAPTPDEFGISIYKRVWDAAVTKRYLEYPFPAWYYAFVAGFQEIATGRDMIIHELQAEPWGPNGKRITEIDLQEQNKSFNAERFEDRFEYAKATGIRITYFWGAEYWYYRKTVLHEPSVWSVAREQFRPSTSIY